jgi:type II secretory pathway pseudopilin PulG
MKLRRPGPGGSDQGSMPMALLITLVAMALSATLMPLVISQVTSTRTVSSRTQALQAAQAGIDVALGQLRSAVGTTGAGDLESLPPCVMTGSADAGWGYRVTIVYYSLAADDTAEPAPQGCPPTDVPVSAILTSTGGPGAGALAAGSEGTRTIEATYTFKTSNQNISGGAIQLAAPTTDPLCMDAGADASPAPGTVVKVQRCKAGGSSDQRFAYTSDLNIKLVGSETASAPAGMCLDVPYPRTAGDEVKFQPCQGLAARQQWSLNDNSNFSSTRENEAKLGDFCLDLRDAEAGQPNSTIVLGSCGGGANRRIFRPQPGVGAGMASAATGQLVNFRQFSRCLDVTNFVPTWSYMIVWFCKQAPDGSIPWNQHWSLPDAVVSAANAEPERIRTAGSGNPGYCLRSPGSTAADQYVTMEPCDATGTLTNASLKWVVYGDTGNYATSYRIVDSFGYCLTPTDLKATPPDTHSDGTAKVKVATCNKSELQKWNAPADLNKPLALTNTTEK